MTDDKKEEVKVVKEETAEELQAKIVKLAAINQWQKTKLQEAALAINESERHKLVAMNKAEALGGYLIACINMHGIDSVMAFPREELEMLTPGTYLDDDVETETHVSLRVVTAEMPSELRSMADDGKHVMSKNNKSEEKEEETDDANL